jgi:hypothetical protein
MVLESKFKETKNHLTYIVRTRFYNRDYDIQKRLLADICNYEVGFENISEWVAHLSGKTWASKRMVLLLCDHIKRLHPDNKINWDETYRFINSINYETQ